MTTKARAGIRQLKFRVPVVVERDTIGFHSYSPVLKGLHMDGDTEHEALENARKTAKEFLETMIQDGIPIPLSILSRDEGGRHLRRITKGITMPRRLHSIFDEARCLVEPV